MAEQHRATADQWDLIGRMRHHVESSCLLELRDRVEAWEIAQDGSIDLSHLSEPGRERPATRLLSYKVGKAEPIENWGKGHTLVDPPATTAQPNHPAKPDSSLKGRIKSRMIDGIGSTWEETSASVLIEVAAWLRDHSGGPTATTDLLEREALPDD